MSLFIRTLCLILFCFPVVGFAQQEPLGRLTFKPGLGDTHPTTQKEMGTLTPQDSAAFRLAA